MSVHSLRELAKSLNLSHATVSEALRGSPRVKVATRLRIEAAAEQLGYRRNPLASALMTELRRSRGGTFRGLLAAVDLEGPEHRSPSAARYHAEVLAGAIKRAGELGFKMDEIVVNRPGYEAGKIAAVLEARGITGVLLLPTSERPVRKEPDWSKFAVVSTDCSFRQAGLHAICPDHHRAMGRVVAELAERGYKRPGLVLENSLGPLLTSRWQAAFLAHLLGNYPTFDSRSALLVSGTSDAKAFGRWFKEGDFDVVVASDEAFQALMPGGGAEVPVTHGFCCINPTDESRACSGTDLRPRAIGRRGLELLTEQVLRNESGEPELPITSLVAPVWQEGCTLRPPSAALVSPIRIAV
jgi:LacI family transcriptional regulator